MTHTPTKKMTADNVLYDELALLHRMRILHQVDLLWDNREKALLAVQKHGGESMHWLMSQLSQEEWLKTMARMVREFDNVPRTKAERKRVPFSTVHSPEWWVAFEARVDATAEPFEELSSCLYPPLSEEEVVPPRTDEDMTPVKLSVFVSSQEDGSQERGEWKNYRFDPRDLNELHFCELPNMRAVEGPRTFKEVVMQAKRKYEQEKGHSVPTVHLFPLTAIQDLLGDVTFR